MSRFWPTANHYHEQPEDGGMDAGEREESLKGGRSILAKAEQAEANGDLEHAQQLRRLIGD